MSEIDGKVILDQAIAEYKALVERCRVHNRVSDQVILVENSVNHPITRWHIEHWTDQGFWKSLISMEERDEEAIRHNLTTVRESNPGDRKYRLVKVTTLVVDYEVSGD